MKYKAITGTMFTVLLTTMLTSVFNIQSVKAYPTVTSSWLTFPVTFDGTMTTAEEWSDTIPVDVTLLKWGTGPGTASARVWMKNDDTWLYLLYRVEWSVWEIDPLDEGFIAYCWDWIGEPPPLWNHSDCGLVGFDGTADFYGYNEEAEYRWQNDLFASPPGENNVEGAATYDYEGTYYWFEFRKELNPGDGYDWTFTPGQIIETVTEVTELYVALYDSSIDSTYQAYVSLHLSTPPCIGDITGPDGLPDGIVDIYDLAFIEKAYGKRETDPNWNEYKIADITGPEGVPDRIVDIYDLALCGKNYGKTA